MYERGRAPMPEQDAVFYIGQLVLALDYLHTKKSIIYRDIKSENIVLDAKVRYARRRVHAEHVVLTRPRINRGTSASWISAVRPDSHRVRYAP